MDKHADRRAFLMSLKRGDVVNLNGKLRVVLNTKWRKHSNYPPTGSITFSILRCSWTRRPYTVKSTAELYHARIALVGRGYKPKLPVEHELQRNVDDHHLRTLECCDVVGVIQ